MRLEDILRPTAKAVLPLYAAFHMVNAAPVSAQPNPKSTYNFIVGTMHKNDGNLELALKSYLNALVADPNSAYLHNEMAELLMDVNRIDDAVMYLKNAVRLDRDFMRPHANLAMIQVLKKDYKGAIDESSFILSKEPDNISGLSISAESYFKLKDYSKARPLFTRMVELDVHPESVSHSTYRLGQINFQDSEYFLAVADFKKAFIMLNRTDPFDRLKGLDILHYITLSYYHMGKFNSAKETLSTLDSLMSKEVNPYLSPAINELRKRINDQDLIRKIDEGIQNKTNRATPNNAIPR
ncbi:MAG: tetratricopeptide repeat protein [archaeon]